MFFYLSFLRPPPGNVYPSSPISVTPQVANDLRTELFDGEQDIFYSWSLELPVSRPKASAFPQITKPQKLTTWREGSAYKEIRVPPPPNVRDGQLWRLVLASHGQGHPHVIDLGSPSVGERPFPVLSMPILLSSTPTRAIGKQEQVERVYRISTGPGAEEQVFMAVKERTSFDLDKKVWDSGIGLSSWIVEHARDVRTRPSLSPLATKVKEALLSKEKRNILELGAGTGIVSLTLGALRSARGSVADGCIVTTDLPSAMPLIEHNIESNTALFGSSSTRPHAVVLDWDSETLPEAVAAVLPELDVILMADVTYNTASFPALVRTLAALTRSSSAATKTPLILLGYKERDPEERTLWDMTREIGIEFERVGERKGAGGQEVEVWIGRVER